MSFLDKLLKATEHKLIDNLIAIWKKVKPSKTYWTIAIPLGLGIFSQAKSWKLAAVIASYAEKQIEGSDYPLMWEFFSAVANEFNDEANWNVVMVGLVVLVIVTYAFGKESKIKSTNYFDKELEKKTVRLRA